MSFLFVYSTPLYCGFQNCLQPCVTPGSVSSTLLLKWGIGFSQAICTLLVMLGLLRVFLYAYNGIEQEMLIF